MREMIFLVDDSSMNLKVAKEALKDYYQVIPMQSAAQMFTALEKVTPSLILLDMLMPEMDGFEALSVLKEKYADIPVIFLTGTTDSEEEAKGIEMGAVDFIIKPFSEPVLLNRIKLNIERAQLIKENKRLLQEIEQYRQEAAPKNE